MISEELQQRLTAPNVAVGEFLQLDLPSGTQFFHSGSGTALINGNKYRGVTDPVMGQLVSISNITDPQFGQAPIVEISLIAPNLDFYRSVREPQFPLEGSRALMSIGVFDAETEGLIGDLIPLFDGLFTAPSFMRMGIGVRAITIRIESFFNAQNFPFGGKWNDATQQRLFPGDVAFEFTGVEISESWA